MAGLAGSAFASGGVDAAVLAFTGASLVLVILVLASAFTIGTAEDRTIETLRSQAPRVKRWGGVILVAVGVWFLLLAALSGSFAELFPV